jgi:hypothetical protein
MSRCRQGEEGRSSSRRARNILSIADYNTEATQYITIYRGKETDAIAAVAVAMTDSRREYCY